MSEQILKLGIPAGSLKNATVELFAKAGFHILDSNRSYLPRIDDEQIHLTMLRAQEMSKYVEDGVIDAGITGYDWIMENGSDVVEICELAYSKATSNPAKWVLAVPNEAQVNEPEDLAGGIVATELVNVTKKYFADKGVDVKVEFSWGATAILLNAAIEARSKVGLKMNIRKDSLDAILKILPAEKSPTVSALANPDFVAIEVIIDDKIERSLVPTLKRAGASGVITYPLNKVIH